MLKIHAEWWMWIIWLIVALVRLYRFMDRMEQDIDDELREKSCGNCFVCGDCYDGGQFDN